jgi:7-cyano-7-deazaguanine synthase
MEKVAILLLSGGVESVTLMHQLVNAGEPVQAVFIDYGQRAAKQERAASTEHCEHLGVELVPLDLSGAGEQFRNVQNAQAARPHVPMPHRNLVAISLGLSYATALGSPRLYLATNREDAAAYPASSYLFLTQFRVLAGILGAVTLATPYIDMSKAQVIARGVALGIDYATTYTCILGYPAHCGRCIQCIARKEAFAAAKISEPAVFYRI